MWIVSGSADREKCIRSVSGTLKTKTKRTRTAIVLVGEVRVDVGGAGGSLRKSARRSKICAIIGTLVVEFAFVVHFSSGVDGGVRGKKCENVIKLVLRPFSSSSKIALVGGRMKILTSLSA